MASLFRRAGAQIARFFSSAADPAAAADEAQLYAKTVLGVTSLYTRDSAGTITPIGAGGPPGPAGANGTSGADGIDGVDGADGSVGPPGPSADAFVWFMTGGS
jgi:hypothetical protein